MADISKIKFNNTDYNIKDSTKLPLAGGTLTGNLIINNQSDGVVDKTKGTPLIIHANGMGGDGDLVTPLILQCFDRSPFGLKFMTHANGPSIIQSQRIDSSTEFFELSLNPNGGIVTANGQLVVVNNDPRLLFAQYAFKIGVCETLASESAKEVYLPGGINFVAGTTFFIVFTNAHTSTTAATVRLNGTGSYITLNRHGKTITASNSWTAGQIVQFVYDGSVLHYVDLLDLVSLGNINKSGSTVTFTD